MGDFVNQLVDFSNQPPEWAVAEAEEELGKDAAWEVICQHAWDLVEVRGDE